MKGPRLLDGNDGRMVALLRQLSPKERVKIGFGMRQFVYDSIRQLLATAHPEWTEKEVCLETGRLMLATDFE